MAARKPELPPGQSEAEASPKSQRGARHEGLPVPCKLRARGPLSAGGQEPGQGGQTGKGGGWTLLGVQSGRSEKTQAGGTRRGALQEAGCRGSVQEPRARQHISTNNCEINFKTPFISFICRILNNSNSQEQR
mgnify:CR=1 FL=1